MSSAAKQIIPIAATAAGAYFGGPMLAGAMGSAAGGAIAGGALGNLAGSLLAGGVDKPEAPAPVAVAAPAVEKPTLMPTPNDAAVRTAKRKAVAAQRQRSGRQSTILTAVNDGDTLG